MTPRLDPPSQASITNACFFAIIPFVGEALFLNLSKRVLARMTLEITVLEIIPPAPRTLRTHRTRVTVTQTWWFTTYLRCVPRPSPLLAHIQRP